MAEAEGGGDSGREDQESSQETIKDDINLKPFKNNKKIGNDPRGGNWTADHPHLRWMGEPLRQGAPALQPSVLSSDGPMTVKPR